MPSLRIRIAHRLLVVRENAYTTLPPLLPRRKPPANSTANTSFSCAGTWVPGAHSVNLHPPPPRPHNPPKLTPHSFPPLGSLPQKGIVTYGLAQNRQNPLAGTFNAAVFNTFRRTRHQILYWGLPLLIAYETMQWAIER